MFYIGTNNKYFIYVRIVILIIDSWVKNKIYISLIRFSFDFCTSFAVMKTYLKNYMFQLILFINCLSYVKEVKYLLSEANDIKNADLN